jgi:hypothetical protein
VCVYECVRVLVVYDSYFDLYIVCMYENEDLSLNFQQSFI